MARGDVVASMDALGRDRASELVRVLVRAARPERITVDAYGLPCAEVEDVRLRLAALAGGRDPSGIEISWSDDQGVELLAAYAPYSARVDIGDDAPWRTLLEIDDGDHVIVSADEAVLDLLGFEVDGVVWKPLVPPSSLLGRLAGWVTRGRGRS